MSIKTFFVSERIRWVLIGVIGVIGILSVFQLGIFIGYYKAQYSFGWGENYHRAFGGPKGGFLNDIRGRDFVNGHGISGVVINAKGDTCIIRGKDGVERAVSLAVGGVVARGRETIVFSDIKVDDNVVVIGSPKNDGSIEAKMIRVFRVVRDASSGASVPANAMPSTPTPDAVKY